MKVGVKILAIIAIILAVAIFYASGYRHGLQGGLEHAKLDSYQGMLQKLAYLKDLNAGKQPFPAEKAVSEFFKSDLEQYLHTEDLNKFSDRMYWNILAFVRGEASMFTVLSSGSASADEQLSRILDLCRNAMTEEEYRLYCADPFEEHSSKRSKGVRSGT